MRKIMQKTMSLVLVLLLLSCSDEMHMLFPEGPQGPQGLSAYEVWVKAVEDGEVDWPKDRTDINNFFIFLKGKDGANGLSAYEIWKEQVETGLDNPHNPGTDWPKDQITLQDFWYYLSGAPGQDGVTPHVGENGNWWIGDTDTGVPARGKDGKDAVAPTVEIGPNGNWYINGEDTGVPARGKDGQNGNDGIDGKTLTITIGDNGNWFVDGEDTGTPATGPKGADGKDGKNSLWSINENGYWQYWDYTNEVWILTNFPSTGPQGDPGADGKDGTQFCIGENGNWWIWDETIGENGDWKDTGKPSCGKDGNDGESGENGLNAYQLWVLEVAEGIENPHNPTEEWPKDKTSMADFWEYLQGDDGKDGKDGKDGVDASGVIQPQPSIGFYNVIADYSNSSHREYVRWADGAVTYRVYNSEGQPVGAGVRVSNMPKMNASLTYTTDASGHFTVLKEELPADANNSIDVYGQPVVTLLDNSTPQVASATYVPCRMQVKVTIRTATLGYTTTTINNKPTTDIYLRFYRKVDVTSEWDEIPTWIGEKQYKCNITTVDEHGREITAADVATVNNAASYNPSARNVNKTDLCNTNDGIHVKRKVKSTSHYDYTRSANVKGTQDHWYGNEGQRYFLGFRITPIDANHGILYGTSVETEDYVEEVPLIPMPYFTDLEGTYNNDGTNIHLYATYCHSCLEGLDFIYLSSYKTQLENINQQFNAWVPDYRASHTTYNGMQLVSLKTTSTGSSELKSKEYSISYLLDNALYLEDVKPGSIIGTTCNNELSRTFFKFPVGVIEETGLGDDATFTIKTTDYPEITHSIIIKRHTN